VGFLRIVFLIFLGAICASAQDDTTLACTIEDLQPADPAVPNSTPIGRILDGDPCVIAAAGNSKDPLYIPYLKRIARWGHHSGDYHSSSAAFAQMALAKLGVEQDLFEIECEIQPQASHYVRLYAIEDKLPYVGGWFALRLAKDMLPDSEQNKENLSYGDQLVPDWHRRKLAIDMLPHILGADSEPFRRFGPAKPGSEKLKGLTEEQVIDGWYHWILDHENEVRNLEPTGDSVDYSEARCEKYLKKEGELAEPKSTHP
jgi:hypothetical protein